MMGEGLLTEPDSPLRQAPRQAREGPQDVARSGDLRRSKTKQLLQPQCTSHPLIQLAQCSVCEPAKGRVNQRLLHGHQLGRLDDRADTEAGARERRTTLLDHQLQIARSGRDFRTDRRQDHVWKTLIESSWRQYYGRSCLLPRQTCTEPVEVSVNGNGTNTISPRS